MSRVHTASLVVGYCVTIGEVRKRTYAIDPSFNEGCDMTDAIDRFCVEADCNYQFANTDDFNGDGYDDDDTVYLVAADKADYRVHDGGLAFDDTIDFEKILFMRPALDQLHRRLVELGLSPGKAHIAVSTSYG